MKISGFSMAKNADKLYYPIKHVIECALPIVDEFVVAIGDCDSNDNTRKIVESISSDKIKIIDTVWDISKYPRGMENAHQTDIAKNACSGDWLLYLQADEVIHEKYLPTIKKACEHYKNDKRVEGFLFKYKHFWGDYDHYHISHGWYPYEIRIIRKDPEIHSWESAQSFRRIPIFDSLNYRIKEGTKKLNVVLIDAYVYHYGWVRPPQLMRAKGKALDTIHHGKKKIDEKYIGIPNEFDYGRLDILGKFNDTHPAVLQDWIKKFDWSHKLNYGNTPSYELHKHEKLKYRILTFIERKLLNGKQIGGFKNYNLIETYRG
ncbi:MAG: glycosyltransferase family 2 protein [Desulfobacterales bacterium]|nr:glycosyltransferase family 2 protein [Desulfobacterales bacterium]